MNEMEQSAASGQGVKCPGGTLGAMIAETFRGPMAWVAVIAWIYMIIFSVIAIISAIVFFLVETTDARIFFAALFLAVAGCATAVKLWYWMLMFHNSIVRRIDEVECNIAAKCGQQPAGG